jgi:preprotein translocase subunit SecF
MKLFKNINLDYIGHAKYFYALSGILALVSLFAIFKIKPVMGVEFTGGTMVQVSFKDLPPLEQVRQSLNAGGLNGFTVQTQPASHAVVVRVAQKELQNKDDLAVQILNSLKKDFAGNVKETPDKIEYIGPVVGKKLAREAMFAIIGSLAVIVIYVAFQFKNWTWGLVGVLALAHDVLITYGVLVLMRSEINLVVIAALLTLAGYSINDTIVIFDRVRENLRSSRKESLKELYNRSVNETLSRTLITAFIALITSSSLFFGGEVLRDFAIAMTFGVLIGSYSTIYVAIASVYHWETSRKR